MRHLPAAASRAYDISTWLVRLPKFFFRLWPLLANTAALVDEVGAPLRRWPGTCAVKLN